VYRAVQEAPVRREVALKIIRLGMDTRQVVARFEAERQALAMMDHPNIAQVFDAGATHTAVGPLAFSPDGRVLAVMGTGKVSLFETTSWDSREIIVPRDGGYPQVGFAGNGTWLAIVPGQSLGRRWERRR
jgi:hypothetical protein